MKKINLIFLIIFFITVTEYSMAQSQKVDSLKVALAESTPLNRFDILWGLAFELYDVNNQEALIFATAAYDWARNRDDTLQFVMSGRIMGQLLRRVDKVDQSLQVLNIVLPVSKRHNFERETRRILNALALAYTFKAAYDKALEFHLQSLIVSEKSGDRTETSTTLNNIGLVYFKLKDHKLALDYYLKSLGIKEEINYSYDLEALLVNIGLCYISLGDYKNAAMYFDRAAKTCGGNCENRMIVFIEHGLGEVFLFERKYEQAEAHFLKSFDSAIKENNQQYQLEDLTVLTRIALVSNDVKRAWYYLRLADALPDKGQYVELLAIIYELKANLYAESGDFRNAHTYQREYTTLKDSIMNSDVKLNVMRAQIQFSQRENLARIEAQAQVLLLQGQSIRRQQILNFALGTVGALIVILAVILYKMNLEKLRINRMLDQKVKERTFELERNRDELKHSHDEQAIVLNKVASDLNASFATLNGLANLAEKELPAEQAIYIKQAEATAVRLIGYVSKYSSDHKDGPM